MTQLPRLGALRSSAFLPTCHYQRRSALILMGLISCTSIVTLLEWFHGPPAALVRATPWLIFNLGCSGLAMLASSRWLLVQACAIGVALSLIGVCATLVGIYDSDAINCTLALTLTWVSPFVRLRWIYALGALALATLILASAHFTWQTIGATSLHFPIFLTSTYLLTPMVLTTVVRLDEQARQRQLHEQLEAVQAAKRDLEAQYRSKSEELVHSQQALVVAERQRGVTELSSGLAHELNNILTPINGLAELLVEGVSSEQSRRYGQSIWRCAQQAAKITEGLLTYARMRHFTPMRTHLIAFLRNDVWPNLDPALASTVQLELSNGEEIVVDIDRRLIKDALRQILRQASEAVNGGHRIVLRVNEVVDAQGEAWAKISIQDTAMRISADEAKSIFTQPRNDMPVSDALSLGLAVIDAVVHQHGGNIEVEGHASLTTGLVIQLPRVPTSTRTIARHNGDTPQPASHRPSAWLCTHDSDLADELEEILRDLGYEQRVVETTQLEVLTNSESSSPQLVLLDVRTLTPTTLQQSAARWRPHAQLVILRQPNDFVPTSDDWIEVKIPLDRREVARLKTISPPSMPV